MCGIVGTASCRFQTDTELLCRMRDSMSHRGPDHAGIWRSPDGHVALAHRRLAIIDLSPGGHQPMTDLTGQLTIVFNGEIYNYPQLRKILESKGHRFRSSSDTEVILEAYRAWGTECIKRLVGAFAFCLYDGVGRMLFLGRDRAGEKPLYYYHKNGRLVFASELKAIMADPSFQREIDLPALNFYLTYGYVPGDRCILKDVNKVLPGHWLTHDLEKDDLHIERYWQVPEFSTDAPVSDEQLVEELESLLTEAVRSQLIADVPLGIMLSGGIDSSLITAMAARNSCGPVKTFTVTFPGHENLNEAPFARIVADYFGTDHSELVAEPASVDLMPKLARQFDEPIADDAIVPMYMISRLIRESATVALSGDGGDELFGGYDHYSWLLKAQYLRKFVPGPIRACVARAAHVNFPAVFRDSNFLLGLSGDVSNSIAHVSVYFDRAGRRRLLSPAIRDAIDISEPENYRADFCRRGLSLINTATEVDFKTTLADGFLVKADRASMLASVEVRNPYLDHRLIEFAFRQVPGNLKATTKMRKILLRRVAQLRLPSALDLNRKQGLAMPLASWFSGKWGTYLKDVLDETDSEIFNKDIIAQLIRGRHQGRANANRLFSLLMFELWRKTYSVNLPNPMQSQH